METNFKFILQEYGGHYYCVLCGHDILNYEDVTKHIAENNHARAVDLNGSHIALWWSNEYRCLLCGCNISGYVNVRCHLKGSMHTEFLNETESSGSDSWESMSSVSSEYDSWESVSSNGCRYMQEMRSIDFILGDNQTARYKCYLCNIRLEDSAAIDKHLSAWQHQDALRIDGHRILYTGNGSYYCRLCKRSLINCTSIYQHITGNIHKYGPGH